MHGSRPTEGIWKLTLCFAVTGSVVGLAPAAGAVVARQGGGSAATRQPSPRSIRQGSGRISGVILTATGPAANDCVTAQRLGSPVTSHTVSNARGKFQVRNLGTGRYAISAFACSPQATHHPAPAVSQTANVRLTARRESRRIQLDLPVTARATSSSLGPEARRESTPTNPDLVLGETGAVSGKVTDSGGNPLSGICVYVNDSYNSYAVTTQGDGTYSIPSVAVGPYHVDFAAGCGNNGNYVTQYYHNTTDPNAATPVQVRAGQTTTGIDDALAAGGVISGTVTDTGANPLSGICVSVSGAVGYVPNAITGSGGTYSIPRLPTGSYRVQFSPQCGNTGNYVTQYYHNVTDYYAATPVHVTLGQTTSGIDDQLAAGGTITGTVRNSGGTALPDICVDVSSSTYYGYFETQSDGTYTVTGLPSGSYRIEYVDCSSSGYATGYYHNTTDSYAATPVSVTAGQTTSGIDDTLTLGGVITGTVTDRDGAAISDVCVDASNEQTYGSAETASDGTYSISGLTTGSYTVYFYNCSDDRYLDQYYNNVTDYYAATPVSVTAGQTTAGINDALVAVPTQIGDFNGDGATDTASYRPSTGQWWIQSFDSFDAPVSYGNSTDIPVPGDYDGDGKTDLAIFRPSTGQWYVQGHSPVNYGKSGDIPVPGDYNGDGKTDFAIYRPSTGQWFIQGQAPVNYGNSTDIPVPGDYDNEGITQIAIYRPSTGQWFIQGHAPVSYGKSGDVPVPADYNGDGTMDLAIYRPSTGQWYVQGNSPVSYGTSTDIPVPADYNRDGIADIAVFRPSTGQWFVTGYAPFQTREQSGDEPLPLPYAIYHSHYS